MSDLVIPVDAPDGSPPIRSSGDQLVGRGEDPRCPPDSLPDPREDRRA